ncbi:hypothetical protein L9F63_018885, partial [Diploptera punctata]
KSSWCIRSALVPNYSLLLHLIISSLSADVLLLALSKDPSDETSHCLCILT